MTPPGTIPTAQAGLELRILRSRCGRLNHLANAAVETQRERERQTDRQTDRDIETKTARGRDRETEAETDR